MRTVTILEGPEFKVQSTGGGTFYTLTHKPTGKSAFLQGEDASRFSDEIEAAWTHFPTYSPDQIAFHLWCDCEYGSIATHAPVVPWGPYCRTATRRTFVPWGNVEPLL